MTLIEMADFSTKMRTRDFIFFTDPSIDPQDELIALMMVFAYGITPTLFGKSKG